MWVNVCSFELLKNSIIREGNSAIPGNLEKYLAILGEGPT
jgi:hypothetical protein